MKKMKILKKEFNSIVENAIRESEKYRELKTIDLGQRSLIFSSYLDSFCREERISQKNFNDWCMTKRMKTVKKI